MSPAGCNISLTNRSQLIKINFRNITSTAHPKNDFPDPHFFFQSRLTHLSLEFSIQKYIKPSEQISQENNHEADTGHLSLSVQAVKSNQGSVSCRANGFVGSVPIR